MENESIFEKFTNKYQISKTLRFELVPQQGTEKLIRKLFEKPEENHHEIIQKDLELFKSYKNVKKLIDCRHRNIIDDVLSNFSFSGEDLETLNNNGELEEDDDTDKKDPLKKLREKVASALDAKSKIMFDNKLLNSGSKNEDDETANGGKKKNKKKVKGKSGLETWMNSADKNYLEGIDTESIVKDLKKMEGFFTYLRGFNKNRENVYSKDKIATAIPFRIVHDSFPIFKKNIENYEKIKKNYPDLAKLIDKKGANEIFKLEYFNKCLTQAGIDIYNIERLGIVAREQGKVQEKGINQIINEYVQQENKRIKEANGGKIGKNEKIRVATFDKLKKQILSISKTKSFQFEVFENTPEIIDAINQRYEFLNKTEGKTNLIEDVRSFLGNIPTDSLEEIYLNEKSISILSKKLFDYGRYIESAMEKWCDDNNKRKFLSKKQFSLKLIEDSINYYLEKFEQNETPKNKFNNCKNPVVEYFKNPTITIHTKEGEKEKQVEKPMFGELEARRKKIDYILNGNYTKDLKEEKGEDSENLKAFLDVLREFNYILSPFFVKDKNLEKDEEFYNERKRLQELIFEADILALYNQTRNYITQKPYTLDKFKLIFENGSLLGGWSKNEEKVKAGVILRENNFYYLAIIDSEDKSVFDNKNLYSNDGEFEKMEMLALKWKTLTGKGYVRDFSDKYSSQVFDYKIQEYKDFLSNNNVVIKEIDEWIKKEDAKKNEDNKFPDDRKVLKRLINYVENKTQSNNRQKIVNGLKELENTPYTLVIENIQNLIKKQYVASYPILEKFLNRPKNSD
ncbi:MAG: hypothetical protein HY840_14825 [Bacteroidetes bacterium]|nr:hypothetical protein [Bacteroidota bacterium]